LLEKLIKPRLASAVEESGGLSRRQHGFRPGRSTIGAIQEVVNAALASQVGNHASRPIVLLATLDVKNAFNSVRWSDMLDLLNRRFHIPEYLMRLLDSYLKDRKLIYQTKGGEKRIDITSGAAQVMIRVNAWMNSRGLQLASEKTELLLVTRKQMPLEIELRLTETTIRTQKTIKYLGVRLDSKLTFGPQIEYARTKAAETARYLSRLMANIDGPIPSRRKLLMNTNNSILLYGCEVWADSLKTNCRLKTLMAIQRTSALRIIGAYRT
ncbi:hypothetical protein KR084_009546, partial [Drosophila pseudotakahashii]